jgi:hypothetical protein
VPVGAVTVFSDSSERGSLYTSRKILSQEITLAVAVAVADIVEHLALRVEKII